MKKIIIRLIWLLPIAYLIVCIIHAFIINGKPKIVRCIESGNVQCVRYYLTKGGDSNLVYGAINSQTNKEPLVRSLLYVAIEQQNLEICQLLLDHGADTTRVFKKQPILFYSVNKFPKNGLNTQYLIIDLLSSHCDINQLHNGENIMQYTKRLGLDELHEILNNDVKFANLAEKK